MSETIYIRETHEFLTGSGHVVKETDLTADEIDEMRKDCSNVSRLFGNVESADAIIKG